MISSVRIAGRRWKVEDGRLLSILISDNSVSQHTSRYDWPIILKALKMLARPGDNGAGDIIARTIGPIGGEAFKKWHKMIFGRECGCNARQEWWNLTYPL